MAGSVLRLLFLLFYSPYLRGGVAALTRRTGWASSVSTPRQGLLHPRQLRLITVFMLPWTVYDGTTSRLAGIASLLRPSKLDGCDTSREICFPPNDVPVRIRRHEGVSVARYGGTQPLPTLAREEFPAYSAHPMRDPTSTSHFDASDYSRQN